MDGVDKNRYLAVTTDSTRPSRSWSGIYSRIVCAPCESRFQRDDQYLIWVYRRLADARIEGDGDAAFLDYADGGKLSRSILSVLFRAHLSPHALFKRVVLGSYFDSLSDYLRTDDVKLPSAFGVALRVHEGPLARSWFAPVRANYSGVNTYHLCLPKLVAFVKVDRRPFPPIWDVLQLMPGQAPMCMRTHALTPSELVTFQRIVDRQGDNLSRMFRAGRGN